MKKMAASCTLAIALIGLLGTFPCAKAQVPISGLPAATTPLGGSELVPIVQGGVTKNAPITAVRGTTGVPSIAGTANQINQSGSPGATTLSLPSNIIPPGTVNGNTVPAASDTFTLNAATQTLTNKSINGSEVNSGTIPSAQLPLATNSVIGGMRADGSTMTCTAGVCSSISGGAGTVTSVTCGTGLSGGTITVSGTCAVAPTSFNTGSGSQSLSGPSEIFACTSTCSVTPPVPVAGYQFCVENDATISTVITMGANSGVFYQKAVPPGTANGYGSSGGTMTSGGAVGDLVCLIGRDTTHYLVGAFGGTWTNN